MYAVLISSNTEEVNEIYSYMQRAVEEIQQPVFYGEKKRKGHSIINVLCKEDTQSSCLDLLGSLDINGSDWFDSRLHLPSFTLPKHSDPEEPHLKRQHKNVGNIGNINLEYLKVRSLECQFGIE